MHIHQLVKHKHFFWFASVWHIEQKIIFFNNDITNEPKTNERKKSPRRKRHRRSVSPMIHSSFNNTCLARWSPPQYQFHHYGSMVEQLHQIRQEKSVSLIFDRSYRRLAMHQFFSRIDQDRNEIHCFRSCPILSLIHIWRCRRRG